MSSNNVFKSDLYNIHNIVQSSMLIYPKEIIISALRDFFSKDSYYHYSKDQWGFPNVTDHTDLEPGADIPSPENSSSILSTRLYIGENYHKDGIFYPAILVKSGGSRYVPISINREKGSVKYEDVIYEDGYGNYTTIKRPKSFVTAGIWEGSVIIDIFSRSLRARDDLAELIGMFFSEISVDYLYDIGIIIKPPQISAPSESDDRSDKLFKLTMTLDVRTEWRREIPVENLIDAIFFVVEFQDLSNPNAPVANNLTINTDVNIIDTLLNVLATT